MLSRLREKIAGFVNRLAELIETRELKESELEDVLEAFKYELMEGDVSPDVAEAITSDLKSSLVGIRVRRSVDVREVVRDSLARTIERLLPDPPDLLERVRERCSSRGTYVIMVMGVNGVGKTTSIAKLAWLLKNQGIPVLLVAGDTFRAGAQEQLARHAEVIGAPIIRARYGGDPAAVAFDAINFAKKRGYCAVIVDTAGRMHTDEDLMSELSKVARVARPDFKLLVIDALTGYDAVEQARAFERGVGVDGLFLAKVDADVKGGSGLSASVTVGKPIVFLGTGQRYQDIVPFTKQWLVSRLVGKQD